MARREAGLLLGTILAVAASAAFLLPHLNNPLPQVDESTYVNAVLESIQRGNVLPTSPDGSPFANKPPLHLWIVRFSFALFGPSFWSARLPSVLATVLTALLLFRAGARWVSPWAGGFAVAFLFLAAGPLKLHGFRAATGDALVALLLAAGIIAWESYRARPNPRAALVVLASVALSTWTKGPWGPLVFLAYGLLTEFFEARDRRFQPPFRRLILAAGALAAAAFGAWTICLAGVSGEGVVAAMIERQFADRIAGNLPGAGDRGWLYLWRRLFDDYGAWLALPFVAFAVSRLTGQAVGGRRWKLVAWALLAPFLASLSRGKLPWYGYASYPGVALLLGASLEDLVVRIAGWARRPRLRTWAGAALLAGLAALWPARHTWGVAEIERRTQAERLLAALDSQPGAVLYSEPRHRRTLYADAVLREAAFTLGKDPRTRWKLPEALPRCAALLVRFPRRVASRYGIEPPRFTALSGVPGAPAVLDACGGQIVAALAPRSPQSRGRQ